MLAEKKLEDNLTNNLVDFIVAWHSFIFPITQKTRGKIIQQDTHIKLDGLWVVYDCIRLNDCNKKKQFFKEPLQGLRPVTMRQPISQQLTLMNVE